MQKDAQFTYFLLNTMSFGWYIISKMVGAIVLLTAFEQTGKDFLESLGLQGDPISPS